MNEVEIASADIKHLKVLYVEDEQGVNEQVTRGLKKFFESVTSKFNGQEALDVFQEEHFDVIITDIKMPIMDGWGMLKAMYALDPKRFYCVLTATDPQEPAGVNYNLKLQKPLQVEDFFVLMKAIEENLKKI